MITVLFYQVSENCQVLSCKCCSQGVTEGYTTGAENELAMGDSFEYISATETASYCLSFSDIYSVCLGNSLRYTGGFKHNDSMFISAFYLSLRSYGIQ